MMDNYYLLIVVFRLLPTTAKKKQNKKQTPWNMTSSVIYFVNTNNYHSSFQASYKIMLNFVIHIYKQFEIKGDLFEH